MSSSPGMRIEVSCDAPYTKVNYLAQTGAFITWSGDIVTPLGNDVTVSKDTPVYWTPAGESSDGDTVTVTVLNGAATMAETVLPITHDGAGWYWIGEGPPPTPGDPDPTPDTLNEPTPFSSLSPNKSARIEWAADPTDKSIWKLSLVNTANGETFISYDYPPDTEFTVLWRDDSYFAALGCKNGEESSTIIMITDLDAVTAGKTIHSGDISYFTDSLYPQNPDAHIVPLRFEKDYLLLSVDWLDAIGKRHNEAFYWNYTQGTYVPVRMS